MLACRLHPFRIALGKGVYPNITIHQPGLPLDLAFKQLEDIPFVIDRSNVIGLVLGVQGAVGAPLIPL